MTGAGGGGRGWGGGARERVGAGERAMGAPGCPPMKVFATRAVFF